jgi:hypothetical protein
MKRIFTSLSFLLFINLLYGQLNLNVLFVIDNKVNTANTNAVLANLAAIGYTPEVFNAVDSARSPRLQEMAPYNFIIWYCSSDGVGLYLWNGTDTDNTDLMAWLEAQPGRALWLMGTDILYDRWMAPTVFSHGDFVYDYLGLQEYHAQAYGDDGGQGVPQLDLSTIRPQFTFTPVVWQFTTAWWVDACLPTPEAETIYQMGPAAYQFADYYSGILKLGPNGEPRLSYFFDPALMDSDEHMQLLLNDGFHFIEGIITGLPKAPMHQRLNLSPNPATDKVNVALSDRQDILHMNLYDSKGQLVLQVPGYQPQLSISNLSNGLYLLIVETPTERFSQKLIKK